MSHSDVVSNHVSHRSSQEMWLIGVDVNIDSNGFGCANSFRNWHPCFSSWKAFATRTKMKFLCYASALPFIPVNCFHSRQKLRCVFLHFYQFSRCVLSETTYCFADVFSSVYLRLVLTLPCFNVHHRHSCVECSKILQEIVKDLALRNFHMWNY